MDKRRELVLQRLSRIDHLNTSPYVAQNEKFIGRPVGTMSIEAALGTYMSDSENTEVFYFKQDTFTKTPDDSKQQIVKQMADYRSVLQQSRLIYSKKSAGSDNTYNYSNQGYDNIYDEACDDVYEELSVYDKLDANRSAGFLLYSYNKRGMHSVLGEPNSAGSYAGFIVEGDYTGNA